MNFNKTKVFVLSVSVLVLVAVLAGCENVTQTSRAQVQVIEHQLLIERQFLEVFDIIQKNHINPSTDREMYYGAMKGLAQALKDPYSTFFTPEEAREDDSLAKGMFVGVGLAKWRVEKIGARIIELALDGPSEKAGLLEGDVIMAIDGKSIVGLDKQTVFQIFHGQGKAGSKLSLTVKRGGSSFVKVITREEFKVPSVECLLRYPDTLQIRIRQFNTEVVENLNDCIEIVDGYAKVILDLRDNPGGLLDVARIVASEWMPPDEEAVICYLIYNNGSRDDYLAGPNRRLFGVKTVVLVNGGSASASEIVAGALQDYGLAIIIGSKTFGKGVGQTNYDFTDGSLLRLVVFRWYTPFGRSVSKVGITPDVEVIVDENQEWDDDPVLDKAIEILNQ